MTTASAGAQVHDENRHDDPGSSLVGGFMASSPMTINLDAEIWWAMHSFLSSGLRHLVVVDATHAYRGILADRQVVAGWPTETSGERVTRVRDLVGVPAPTLTAASSAKEASRLMLETGTDALAVVDDRGRPVGIVTGSDLVRVLAHVPRAVRYDPR